jgi:hypothetical protein
MSAVVIGLAFGFFLERAGLGNGRKLAAQFYLTDLTVFKVMFTAIVTAMLGLFWLSQAGLLDLSRIELTPTFLVPQVVGGVLFGAGFVIGGYCPGTSCVAAATGRLDGLAVFGGMILGILLFGEAYSFIQPFADSTSLGTLNFPQLFGIRPGVLVGGVTLGAVGAFLLSERIERQSGALNRVLGLAIVVLGLLAMATPGKAPSKPAAVKEAAADSTAKKLPQIRGGGCFR